MLANCVVKNIKYPCIIYFDLPFPEVFLDETSVLTRPTLSADKPPATLDP